MTARLRARLHGMRPGHHVYEPARFGLLGPRIYCLNCLKRWFL